jgi:hypothetical protein
MALPIEGRGTHPWRVGNDVRVAVPIDVAGRRHAGHQRPGEQGLPVGEVGLRSLPAKQDAAEGRPMRWVPLAGLEPATCCLEDVSAPSSGVRPVLSSQVIPEGAGAVKTSWPGFLVVRSRPGGVGTCRVKAAGPCAAAGRPRSGRRLDTDAVRCPLSSAREVPHRCRCLVCLVCGRVGVQGRVGGRGRPARELPVIPSPCKAWSGSTPTVGRGQSDGSTTPSQMGVMTCATRADRCLVGFMPPAGGCGRRAARSRPGR